MEIWKPITKQEGRYEVSNFGRIASLIKERKILKPHKDTCGYMQVELSYNVKSVHRLVALAFIENPENKPQVNHKNGVKSDNRVDNLEWCTKSENLIHAFRVLKVRNSSGINNSSCKLTESEVLQIRRKHKNGVKQSVLSKIYGVHFSTIHLIIKNKKWKHI